MQISLELFVYNHKNKQVLQVQFTLQIFVHDYLFNKKWFVHEPERASWRL